MPFTLTPLLAIQRDLYALPRGQTRFNQYIKTMTGGTEDVVLPPLSLLNPMGKQHVARLLDTLLGIDAEGIAAAALTEANQRLNNVMQPFQVGLVVVDDAHGGWTNRYFSEASLYFALEAAVSCNWVAVPCWTSVGPTPEGTRQEVLAMVYRAAFFMRYGEAQTLGQMMTQEGLTALFAGATYPTLDVEELDYTQAVINPHRDSTHYPTVFACLYGDEIAASVGYPTLGLSPRAGYAVARAEAQASTVAPEAYLALA